MAQEQAPQWTLFWRDGLREVVRGRTVEEAMTLAGHGAGTLGALDFHAPGDEQRFYWNTRTLRWERRSTEDGHGAF